MSYAGKQMLTLLARALEPSERDSVLGDLAEIGVSDWQAIKELAGLIVRREAALWTNRRPWLALVGIVLPLGYLFSRMATEIAGGVGLYASVWWASGALYSSGRSANEEMLALAAGAASVGVGTWMSGFVLGALARRTVWLHGSLFLLGWLLFRAVPVGIRAATASRTPPPEYYVAFLALVLFVPLAAILLPSLVGIRQGRRRLTMTSREASMLAVVVAVLTALRLWSRTRRASALHDWSEGVYAVQAIDWTDLAIRTALMTWPMLYILVTARRQSVPAR